jgi:hypothetical protein
MAIVQRRKSFFYPHGTFDDARAKLYIETAGKSKAELQVRRSSVSTVSSDSIISPLGLPPKGVSLFTIF